MSRGIVLSLLSFFYFLFCWQEGGCELLCASFVQGHLLLSNRPFSALSCSWSVLESVLMERPLTLFDGFH